MFEKEKVWGYIKSLRIDYLIHNIDLTCERNFIPSQNIFENVENLTQMFGDKSSQDMLYRNLSRIDIDVGGEMFIALNSCPSFHEKLYWKVIQYNLLKFVWGILCLIN